MKILTLDRTGILLALVFGAIIYYFLDWKGVALMLVFLISSAYVTKIGYGIKSEKGIFDYTRGWRNVFSNGIIPGIFASMGNLSGFISSVASITAEKFGSELGV